MYDAVRPDLYALFGSGNKAASAADSSAAVAPPAYGRTAEELAGETQALRAIVQERADAPKDRVQAS